MHLNQRDLSQSQIADLLGITQAAVSKYLNQGLVLNEQFPTLHSIADRLEKLIVDERSTSDQLVKALC